MAEPRFEMETHLVVYDNDQGHKVSIKPDSDGLGLVELDGGIDYGRLVLSPEMANLVAMALARVAATMLGTKEVA